MSFCQSRKKTASSPCASQEKKKTVLVPVRIKKKNSINSVLVPVKREEKISPSVRQEEKWNLRKQNTQSFCQSRGRKKKKKNIMSLCQSGGKKKTQSLCQWRGKKKQQHSVLMPVKRKRKDSVLVSVRRQKKKLRAELAWINRCPKSSPNLRSEGQVIRMELSEKSALSDLSAPNLWE